MAPNHDESFAINRALWDQRADIHVDSAFYDVAGFKAGQTSLNPLEIELLGDLTGQDALHLQCHFGLDTLSLLRHGARSACGIDLSPNSIAHARALAAELGLPAEFICANVLDAEATLTRQFDLVYTSYGVLGWLPELTAWARLIQRALKPGGRFVIVEFHPVRWIFDDDFEGVAYAYFNDGPIVEQTGTYTDGGDSFSTSSVGWNHSFAEIFGALLGEGLRISHFGEYASVPYPCFNRRVTVDDGYQIAGMEGKLPLLFSLVAHKPA